MGGGEKQWLPERHWTPGTRVDLAELERLRMLAKYEFEGPLTTDDLTAALRACHNNTHAAYLYLKERRQRAQQLQTMNNMSILDSKTSSGSSNSNGSISSDSSKRRMDEVMSGNGFYGDGNDNIDEELTPNKKRKESRSLRLLSSQPLSVTPTTQDAHMETTVNVDDDTITHVLLPQQHLSSSSSPQPTGTDYPTTIDKVLARQLVEQTVDDRVNECLLSNSQWIDAVWENLQVSAGLELTKQLDVTTDALANWLKHLDERNRLEQKQHGLDLILDTLTILPRGGSTDELNMRPIPSKEDLDAHDAEIAQLNDSTARNAHARSIASKNAITRLTAICGAYVEQLSWFAQARYQNRDHQTKVREQMQTLQDRTAELLDKCTQDVKVNDTILDEAKELKETRAMQLRKFVSKRREELIAGGETEASAEFQAYSEVLHSSDAEIVFLRQSREDSDLKVQDCQRTVTKSQAALLFYTSMHDILNKAIAMREASLQKITKQLEELRTASEARANQTLKSYIPMLTDALLQYYEFHTVQQTKAHEEKEEQERALEAHLEYFGDSAPIKKEDIERRIHEFVGVINRSMHVMLEIAESQSRLWEGKKDILSFEICEALIYEYGKVWKQLSGPVREVIRDFVGNMEKGSGSVTKSPRVKAHAVSNAVSPVPEGASLSPVMAPGGAKSSVMYSATIHQGDELMSDDVEPMQEESIVESTTTSSTPADENRAKSSSGSARLHEFDVGTVLYSKFNIGENRTQFYRGQVAKCLSDGSYSMRYDDGDIYTVKREYLFTQEQMEEELQMNRDKNRDTDANMEDINVAPNNGTCVVM